jgi:hypothetical protein
MKQPRKYRRRAEHYRVLAKGYSALKSTNLAMSAEGAAEAFEQMACQSGDAAEVGDVTQVQRDEAKTPREAIHELQS